MTNMIETIAKIPSGRMFRLSYHTEVELNKEAKAKGIKIVKYVETTTRTGIAYKNIASVIEKIKEKIDTPNKKTTTNNWEYIIDNKVKHNTNTNCDYLCVANIKKGANTKVKYKMYTANAITEFSYNEFSKIADLIKKHNSEFNPYMTIKLSNIDKIKYGEVNEG